MRKIRAFSNSDWDNFRSLEGMVRLVLITVWDPIGVFGYPEPLDEYDNYVLGVVGILESGATVEEIETHLLRIHETKMGFKLNEFVRNRFRYSAETLSYMYENYRRFP